MNTPAIDDAIFRPQVFSDPFSYYGRLRDTDPVHWNQLYELWIVTPYDLVVQLARDHKTFTSSERSMDPRPPYPPVDSSSEVVDEVRQFYARMFIQNDPPAHTVVRDVLRKLFTPPAVERLRPRIRGIVAELVERIPAGGVVDVMSELAVPLPIAVVSALIGVPEEDRPRIRGIAEVLLRNGGPEPDRMEHVLAGIRDITGYLGPLIEERRRQPADDILSLLADAERIGLMTREESLANAAFLLLAGHETTIDLICNGLLEFSLNPGAWQDLAREPNERAVRAVEECLRFDPPVTTFTRVANRNTTLGRRQIRRHDRVRGVIASANRDPNIFGDPDRFDIARSPNRHISFGSGIHSCLGAPLARLEGQEVLLALASLHRRIDLGTDALEYHRNIVHRSLRELSVSFS